MTLVGEADSSVQTQTALLVARTEVHIKVGWGLGSEQPKELI